MTTTATGTIVDQLIAACTAPCRGCDGSGSEPAGPAIRNMGPGPRSIPLGGKCQGCGGRGRLLNDEGRKLAAFLGVQAHYMNPTPG